MYTDIKRYVRYNNKTYVLVRANEQIKEGAIHTLDGMYYHPIMSKETVGQTPNVFWTADPEHERQFYNPI